MPEPLLPIAVQPRAKTDEDKLAGRAAAAWPPRIPTLRIEQNPETHQIVLWCMGEAHAGVVLDALSRRYGCRVDTVELRVPLRETLGGKAKGHGRHVKQSGGHGQYAVCDIEVEPLPEGSDSSSSTRSSAERCRASSSRASRRACARRWRRASRRGDRLSGRRHPGDAVRRQGAQRRLVGFRVPDGRWRWRCVRPPRPRRVNLLEPVDDGVGGGARRPGRRGDG